MPWEPAPAAIGYPFGGTRIRAGLSSPRSGPQPAGRGRRETARRRGGDQSGGPPSAKRSPGCTGKPGDRPARPLARRGYPNNFRANRHRPDGPRGYRDAHTSSVVTCASSTVAKRPTVVMGDRPGGFSRRRYATQPSPSRVTVPRIFVAQVPDLAGVELPPGQAGPLVGFGVGFLPGVLEADGASYHPRTRTYVWRMPLAAPGTRSGGRSPEAALVQHNIWWAGPIKWTPHTYVCSSRLGKSAVCGVSRWVRQGIGCRTT